MSNEQIPLLQIVSLGQIEKLRDLLRTSKIDVNETDENGGLAVVIAARRNDLSMLRLLVEHGAKLNEKDGWGRTVDGWARKHNNIEMLTFIESVERRGSSKTTDIPCESSNSQRSAGLGKTPPSKA
jgi:ankyrin repeat protein